MTNSGDVARQSVVAGVPFATVLPIFVVMLGAALLLTKTLRIDNAVVLHDEYVHRFWSDNTL